jgi:hypothetical protein
MKDLCECDEMTAAVDTQHWRLVADDLKTVHTVAKIHNHLFLLTYIP